MGIESTRDISRSAAIDKIESYISLRLKLESLSNEQLDELLHKLKYELDVDIFENYRIVEDKK